MALFDANEYDPARDRRRKRMLLTTLITLLFIAALVWYFWNLPQERKVANFFEALQQQRYEDAYGIWMNDPNWKQNPQKYSNYPFPRFELDWGPSGEWGRIQDYKVDGSKSYGSGVIVVVTVNGRSEKARMWVEKSDGTLTWSPR